MKLLNDWSGASHLYVTGSSISEISYEGHLLVGTRHSMSWYVELLHSFSEVSHGHRD